MKTVKLFRSLISNRTSREFLIKEDVQLPSLLQHEGLFYEKFHLSSEGHLWYRELTAAKLSNFLVTSPPIDAR